MLFDGSVRITGFQESLQFSSVSRSLFKIPAHAHADCDLDRNGLAFQVSWKISIACLERHKTDKCNCTEMESYGGSSVRANDEWRRTEAISHSQPMNLWGRPGRAVTALYSSVLSISRWTQTSYEIIWTCTPFSLENTVHWMHKLGHVITMKKLNKFILLGYDFLPRYKCLNIWNLRVHKN